jgi:triosephosphate isomerase
MGNIFINLKRFDVPRTLGGICPYDDPIFWIKQIIERTVELGLGEEEDSQVVYFVPESLLRPALDAISLFPDERTCSLEIGSQGVYWENIAFDGNFGAFTTFLPAAAAKNLGARWAIIGHSEERKGKLSIFSLYNELAGQSEIDQQMALHTVNSLINREVLQALDSGLNILLCIGETSEERGTGAFEQQKPRIQKALSDQIKLGLDGLKDHLGDSRVVIGYEPIWAIGPGKTPPDADYIDFVAAYIKETVLKAFDLELEVVYGGGLKKDNAEDIGSAPSLDGGLVALTQFSDPIGFDPDDLKDIINLYYKGEGKR